MKKMLAVITALIISLSAYAQIEAPVKWAYVAKRTSPTEATVFLKATLQDGWHIYSQNVKDGGPIKTSFTFKKSPDYVLVGKTIEPKPTIKYVKVFSMNIGSFEKEVIFQQKIKVKPGKAITVKGELEFQTCNDVKCLPPDGVSFAIPVGV